MRKRFVPYFRHPQHHPHFPLSLGSLKAGSTLPTPWLLATSAYCLAPLCSFRQLPSQRLKPKVFQAAASTVPGAHERTAELCLSPWSRTEPCRMTDFRTLGCPQVNDSKVLAWRMKARSPISPPGRSVIRSNTNTVLSPVSMQEGVLVCDLCFHGCSPSP